MCAWPQACLRRQCCGSAPHMLHQVGGHTFLQTATKHLLGRCAPDRLLPCTTLQQGHAGHALSVCTVQREWFHRWHACHHTSPRHGSKPHTPCCTSPHNSTHAPRLLSGWPPPTHTATPSLCTWPQQLVKPSWDACLCTSGIHLAAIDLAQACRYVCVCPAAGGPRQGLHQQQPHALMMCSTQVHLWHVTQVQRCRRQGCPTWRHRCAALCC
jgi:hypothetical protein